MARNGNGRSHSSHDDSIEDALLTSPAMGDTQLKSKFTKDLSRDPDQGPLRGGESKYENQQSREEALRRELESVRAVNEAIEGVIESLDRAKSSMRVSTVSASCFQGLTNSAGGQSNCQFSFYSSQYVDADTLANRA